ncbi:MAG TPA: hypothetical protein PK458_05145 [Phycisphaerae bacterium]|nr:hypothetical protein [Phycisphaerae bacterium]
MPLSLEQVRRTYSPHAGRMDDSTQRRHLPRSADWSLLWSDTFDRDDLQPPSAWSTFGAPALEPCRFESIAGVEITAPANASGVCGLERRLDPDLLRGRTVQLSLDLSCPSSRRLERLRHVRVSVVAEDSAGAIKDIRLPLHAEVAPGWEPLYWHMKFSQDVTRASLRIELAGGGAGLCIRRIEMRARPEPDLTASTQPGPASRPAGAAVNLIAGGDFETHRRAFFASHLRDWPGGDRTALPLEFEYDTEAVVGERSLRLRIPAGTGRIGFGPLNLHHPVAAGAWHLKLYARASQPARMQVNLRTARRTLGAVTLTLRPEWQTLTHVFKVTADSPEQRADLHEAELILDIPNDALEPLECSLDAVSLTDAPVETYLQAEPVEVGIAGPVPVTSDLANIVAEGEPAVFSVELAANPLGQASALTGAESPLIGEIGTLTIDVLDAWDRSVYSRTINPVMPRSGKLVEKISIELPRGYYRLLASLWSGEPGASELISQDRKAAAVISFDDPVPLGNRYGLRVVSEAASNYTTALGVGWVLMDLPASAVQTTPGVWDISLWQSSLDRVKQADVELVAAVTVPTSDQYRKPFLEELMANNPLPPLGMVISPPASATRPAAEYREQMEWVSRTLAAVSPHGRVILDVSALETSSDTNPTATWSHVPNLVVGYASTRGAMPESSEPLLERIGERYAREFNIWDLGVPVLLGANVLGERGLDLVATETQAGPVVRIESPPDPVRAASHMVRSILIRALAGAQMVCCDAVALDPPTSLYESDRRRLHERDLTPRPALVALERMASLLNDATLVRWLDQPDGCRILYFEKDDGGAVAAIWRPFGWSPTYLSFAGLPATMEVIDCFGTPEPLLMSGYVRLVPVNEMVRFIVAPPGQAALLAEAVDASRVRPAPALTAR